MATERRRHLPAGARRRPSPFLEAHFNADEAAIASWSWPDAGSATAPRHPRQLRARAAQPDRAGPVLWSREEAPPAVATPASAPEAAPGRAAPPDRAGPVQWSREEAPPAVTTPARREVAPAAPVSFDGLGLPSEAAAALDDVVRRLPALGAPLVDLVKKRPGLFAGPTR
ncbi:MAG: hypothetical protein IPJ65_34585 [Archangiaceae bacterium]|nr:hypothetical protein [Archangiaceae bacterium]